jgi:glutaminyl-peptide cyclotransferase
MVWLRTTARAATAPALVALLFVPACANGRQASAPGGAAAVEVIGRFPHDRGAYTQGLVIHNGVLYEGTGLVGESGLREVDLETGEVLRRVDLTDDRFGEGIAVVGNRIYQLTWQDEIGFIYDRQSFALLDSFSYSGEGWGLTYDGQALIMSDGSATLRYMDPADFSEIRTLQVTDRGAPLTNLNELEYIEGEIWANVYQSDYIVRIDPSTGEVSAWIDLRGLLPQAERGGGVDVLNGIAWDSAGRRVFVTGKRWPWLYHIEVRPPGR